MENKSMQEYKNPPVMQLLWAGIIIFIIGSLISILFNDPLTLFIGVGVSTVILILMVYIGLIRHPRIITTSSCGINLKFLSGKSYFIPWEDIDTIRIFPEDPPGIWNKSIIGGGIIMKSGGVWGFSREIAQAIQDAYYENTR